MPRAPCRAVVRQGGVTRPPMPSPGPRPAACGPIRGRDRSFPAQEREAREEYRLTVSDRSDLP